MTKQILKRERCYGNVPSIKWYSCFCTVLFDLVVRTGTKRVGTHQAGFPILFLVMVGQFSTSCRLS